MTGAIRASGKLLDFVSYDALTMAAQFNDETLPSKFERNNFFELTPGDYRIRVIQTYDPSQITRPEDGAPHFIVEHEPRHADTSA